VADLDALAENDVIWLARSRSPELHAAIRTSTASPATLSILPLRRLITEFFMVCSWFPRLPLAAQAPAGTTPAPAGSRAAWSGSCVPHRENRAGWPRRAGT